MFENDYNHDHAHVKLEKQPFLFRWASNEIQRYIQYIVRQNIQQMSLAPWLCGQLGMPTKVFFNLDWFASKHLSSMWGLFFLRTSWLFCRCKHGYVWKVLQLFCCVGMHLHFEILYVFYSTELISNIYLFHVSGLNSQNQCGMFKPPVTPLQTVTIHSQDKISVCCSDLFPFFKIRRSLQRMSTLAW